MPGVASSAALEEVCHQVGQSQSGGTSADFNYMKTMLQDLAGNAIIAKDREEEDLQAQKNVSDLIGRLDQESDDDEDLDELAAILKDRDMQDVLAAQDSIAKESAENTYSPEEADGPIGKGLPPAKRETSPEPVETTKIIGIRRQPNQPLGITVSNEQGELVVVRIMEGSVVDQQGLLKVGDVLKEVNGHAVSSPEDVTEIVRREGSTNVQFKVIPRSGEHFGSKNFYLRAFFNYEPSRDTKLPARDRGLRFEDGDVLHIDSKTDATWWEATNTVTMKTGCIPSPLFEEKRRAMPSGDGPKKKSSSLLCGLGRKKKYDVSKASETPPVLYEPVCHAMPIQRKLLILVGAQGVGRRSLKNSILGDYPEDFGAALPNTSRLMREKEVDGVNYHFLSRATMDRDIKAGRYLEYGELHNNLYGTSVDAVREVVEQGKTCVVDVKAGVLNKLRTPEWMPFVVFLSPPSPASIKLMNTQALAEGVEVMKKTDAEADRIYEDSQRIHRQYRQYFDSTVIYDNFGRAVSSILKRFENANTEAQWLPAEWAEQNPEVEIIGDE